MQTNKSVPAMDWVDVPPVVIDSDDSSVYEDLQTRYSKAHVDLDDPIEGPDEKHVLDPQPIIKNRWKKFARKSNGKFRRSRKTKSSTRAIAATTSSSPAASSSSAPATSLMPSSSYTICTSSSNRSAPGLTMCRTHMDLHKTPRTSRSRR